MDKATGQKTDFYTRHREEYSKAKPYLYEFNPSSTQAKHKKFKVIVEFFSKLYRGGMKEEYLDEVADNYWDQLVIFFPDMPEIKFTHDLYEKKNLKLEIFFVLLIYEQVVFQKIEEIVKKMGYLYTEHKQKIEEVSKQLALVDFMKDKAYIVSGDIINSYKKYLQTSREQEVEKEREQKQKKDREEAEIRREAQKKQLQKLEADRREAEEAANRKIREANALQRQAQQKLVSRGRNEIQSSLIPAQYNPAKARKKVETPEPRQETYYLNKEVKSHLKKSDRLFEEMFAGELSVFSFKLKPEVSSAKQFCFDCKRPLSKGVMSIGGNINFCHYTGEWFCNDHISMERLPIPWKALESFDLRGYSVSVTSRAQIRSYYEKPILEIKNDDTIVRENKAVYDFLVLKRQIHLMYDSICNSDMPESILKGRLNYCLRRHLFSLKNLYDIYNEHEIISLEKEYNVLSSHFYRCQICQHKKGYICGKCKLAPKIFSFELKECHCCRRCRKMYHRRCLVDSKCDCERE